MTQTALSAADVIRCRDRREWLEQRRHGIGSSDAAAIWGASSWQSAYSVAWHKLGPIEDDAPDIIQRVGHALEPFIAELFSEATGVETIDMGDFTVYQHRELSFLQCTPDRLTPAGEIVELKTASFAAAKEWKEHIPLGYQIQLSHQMAVMGADRAYIAVLINGSDFRYHPLDRNPRFERKHIAKCMDFWKTYVERGEYPPVDYSDATATALANRYREPEPTSIELPSEFDELGAEYETLSASITAAEKQKKLIQNRVKEQLGNASVGVLGDGAGFSWKGNPRRFGRIKKGIENGE